MPSERLDGTDYDAFIDSTVVLGAHSKVSFLPILYMN